MKPQSTKQMVNIRFFSTEYVLSKLAIMRPIDPARPKSHIDKKTLNSFSFPITENIIKAPTNKIGITGITDRPTIGLRKNFIVMPNS